jgi:hypothetical protein
MYMDGSTLLGLVAVVAVVAVENMVFTFGRT